MWYTHTHIHSAKTYTSSTGGALLTCVRVCKYVSIFMKEGTILFLVGYLLLVRSIYGFTRNKLQVSILSPLYPEIFAYSLWVRMVPSVLIFLQWCALFTVTQKWSRTIVEYLAFDISPVKCTFQEQNTCRKWLWWLILHFVFIFRELEYVLFEVLYFPVSSCMCFYRVLQNYAVSWSNFRAVMKT